jgi:diguanylate cyclase (GGDEF)-like protein/PAS domain S-box-containing protein
VSLTGLFLFSYRSEFERQQQLRARTLAQFVARQCEVPALIGDRGSVEKVAATALISEDVLAVSIRYRGSPPQEVLAKRPETRDAESNLAHIVGNSWVEDSEDIRPVQNGLLDWDNVSRAPDSIGRVRLRISLRKEQALFLGIVEQSLAVIGGLMILIPAVQFFRTRRLLRPLASLVAFTRRIGSGDLAERSPVDQVDEIGDVAIAFNQMLDRLGRTTVSRNYVDNIIHSMAECLIVVGPDGKIRTVNEAALILLGYEESDLIGQPGSVVAADDLPTSMRTISATERMWRRRDGEPIPVLFSSAALRKSESGEEGMVWIAQDITDQKRVREELIAARERYALAVAGANDGIWDWNVLDGEVYYSPRWMSMLGYDDGDLPSRIDSWFGLLHPEDRARVEQKIEEHRIGVSEMFESEHRMRHRDGTYHWMLNRGLAVRGPDGTATRIAGSQTDITQNKVSDPLTGLPNRVHFTERLGAAFSRRRIDPAYRCAVLFLDLDRFKMINDSLGHLAGDQLLIGIADRLRAGVQTEQSGCSYTIARLSGDEFAVLLEGAEQDAGAAGAAVGARLIQDMSAPFLIGGREIFTSVSIGVAPDTGDYSSPAEILRDADTAMYRAKAAGKSRCEVFDSDMRAQAVMKLELDTDLRKALERNQFVVYYQPKFSIPGEKLLGFEALVRWSHPRRGLVLPSDFIPLVEETGLIVDVGAFVLRASCRQMREWQVRYPQAAHAVVSVNISPRQFLVPDLPQLIANILEETELNPQSLALEITETVLMGDSEKAVSTLEQLRDLGVGLRIDDFGTGYSSLNYLHRFPFDTVKIDRSFVANLDSDEGVAIVKAIVTLAENLGMKVVAEGVETSRQMRILTRLGCHSGQGYYYSRPVPAKIAEVILSSSDRTREHTGYTGSAQDFTQEMTALEDQLVSTAALPTAGVLAD